MVRFLLLLALLVLTACNNSNGGSGKPPPFPSYNFLTQTSFSGNVLQRETLFISYSLKAKRVSIINPQQEIEVWGKAASGFNFALPLPDYSGGSLFASDRLVVMAGDAQKTFAISHPYAYVASAPTTAAYALASVDGKTIEVIRSLGAGEWQQETFSVPWGAVDPDYTQAPAGQPVLLVANYNNNGTTLAAFAPADGRYAVYEAGTPGDKIQNTTQWCAGDGVGTVTDATFRSLAWDESLQTYYAGDKNGRIYAVDPYGACTAVADLSQLALPDAVEITRINLFSPGRIGVIQDAAGEPGKLTIVDYDGSTFSVEPNPYNNVCEVPLGAIMMVGDYMAVMCTDESALQTPYDGTADPKDTWIIPSSFKLYNTNTMKIVNSATVDSQTTSGMAIDPIGITAYRMLEGGFGDLQTIDMVTGETRITTGLYLKDILN